VASGGTLQSTDGAAMTTISGAPTSYKIMSFQGRVVSSGDPTNPHQIILCGPGDETDWDTVSGNAKKFDIDLGAGSGITDFNIYANDIVVFKGPEQKGIYRLIVPEGDFSAASVKQDSLSSSSINWHTSVGANNNLYFLDYNGWKSIKGVVAYGDIEQDPIGQKINSVITPAIDKDYAFMFHNPYYSQIWLRYANVSTIYVFHYLQNNGKGSFMPIQFKDLTLCSACYLEDSRLLLMGMNDGYVYKLDTVIFTDNGVAVPSYIRTKRVPLGGINYIKKLTRTILEYEAVEAGLITLEALTNSGNVSTSLISQATTSIFTKIYNATTLLHIASESLYGQSLKSNISNKNIWHYDLQYLLSANSGGIKLNGLESLLKIWGRRQA
jgi:hypothetical protein